MSGVSKIIPLLSIRSCRNRVWVMRMWKSMWKRMIQRGSVRGNYVSFFPRTLVWIQSLIWGRCIAEIMKIMTLLLILLKWVRFSLVVLLDCLARRLRYSAWRMRLRRVKIIGLIPVMVKCINWKKSARNFGWQRIFCMKHRIAIAMTTMRIIVKNMVDFTNGMRLWRRAPKGGTCRVSTNGMNYFMEL